MKFLYLSVLIFVPVLLQHPKPPSEGSIKDYFILHVIMNWNLLVKPCSCVVRCISKVSSNLVFSNKLGFCCFYFVLVFACINVHFVCTFPPQKVYIQQRNSNIFFLADRGQTLGSCKSELKE